MGRNGRRAIAVLAIAGLGLVATACGGDDDDDAAPAASDDNGDGGDNADDNEDDVKVDDIKDIPDECLDVFKDFLKEIEPVVEDVDWENADLSAMEDIGTQLESVASGMEDDMPAECDKYELSDETNMDTLIQLAKDEAPGTVGYFEFIQQMQEDFADMTIPDMTLPDNVTLPDNITIPDITIPDITIPDITVPGGANAADLPTDCQGAIDYIHDLMDQYDTMMDMPVSEMTAIGNLSTTITSACSVNEMSDFYNDPDVTAWMSGT